MTAKSQPVDLGILLALAYQEFVRGLRHELASAGFADLGHSDGFVFRALGVRPMTVTDLAARLEVTKQGAAQIVDDMQGRGLVERRPDPSDGRARLLHLTERGESALDAARRFHQRYERGLVRSHGRVTIDAMREVLESIAGGEDRTLDPHLRALFL